MKKQRLIISLIILSVLILLCLPLSFPNKGEINQFNYDATIDDDNLNNIENAKNNEWLIKWKRDYDLDISEQASILDWLPAQGIMRVKLNDSTNVNEWINLWKDNPDIEYIQPNIVCKISEIPNDKYYQDQYYLQQIKVEKAWEINYSNEVIVAVLDTGVDISHPDLQGKLINGVNILNKDTLPIDDNGHGTNVTGIVAAVSNNFIGISGITRNAKIMPVKVLDNEGKSDSFYVGQGIRYAVDNGAKIILLASGETVYTPFMTEAVNYAEEKGVLIIAATGNKGSELNYPAALPNVLSVGAVDRDDNYLDYSNYGQQLDVVAPGDGIFTTTIGGGYSTKSGTSMAAPQVAGLAAMLFQRYPDLTPNEIADIIRFSADDVGELGWDVRTGYGRINVEKALNMDLNELLDAYYSNQTSKLAHVFPLGNTFKSQFNSSVNVGWYWFSLPYAGKIAIDLTFEKRPAYDVNLEIYTGKQISDKELLEDLKLLDNYLDEIDEAYYLEMQQMLNEQDINVDNVEPYLTYQIKDDDKINLELPEGKYYIKISYPPEQFVGVKTKPLKYTISNKYVIYKDAYEPNDKPWQAYEINNISQVITGTFDKNYDEDWFKIYIPNNGTLSAELKVDTKRIDPVLWMQPVGGIGTEIDYNSSGVTEVGNINVTAGEYLIRVSDYNNNIINDEYHLTLIFKMNDNDIYEPNNSSIQATNLIKNDQLIDGSIYNQDDYDWFKFEVFNKTYTKFNIIADNSINITLFNNNLDVLLTKKAKEWEQIQVYDEGTYYLRLNSNEDRTKYSCYFKKIELEGNFIDINEHPAHDIILQYYEDGLISGYGDYTFKPDKAINRGEVATFLDNILKLDDVTTANSYTDITKDSDLYLVVNKIIQAEIMTIFEDNTFRPDTIINQEDLVIILNNIYKGLDINYIREVVTEMNLVPYSSISRSEFLNIYDLVNVLNNQIINKEEIGSSLKE